MLNMKVKLTGARIAICVSILCLFSPFFISRNVLPFGFSVFFCWAALCVASVLADRLLVWAALTGSALFVVCVDWWMRGPPPTDEFGYFGAVDAIALFAGTALVTAGTGVLSIVRTATEAKGSVR